MYLIDTNIFLEILLKQEKKEICKKFLSENIGNLYISDFSLHSIGVILFKNEIENIFQKCADDVISKINIVSLPKTSYIQLSDIKKRLKFDFDDAYQYETAKIYELEIVTMDNDFIKVKDKIKVRFL